MFSSDKGIIASQNLQAQKSKGKNIKSVYRELADNEKNLLNFQFTDYHEYHGHYHDYPSHKSKPLSFVQKKLLKMSYLQGNFKFLVNPDYEENIAFVDPDQEIKWKTVVKVKYSTSSLISCPICLNDVYDMMFPKITRCGHIFCLACIIKYLSYKKTKCPLCDDFLMEEDLRGVEIQSYQFAKPGEKIFLRLKKRRRLENTVYNVEDFTEEDEFVRIKRLSWEDILKYNEEEMRQMLDYMTNLEIEHDKDNLPFIELGINSLTMRIEKIQKASMLNKQKRSKGSEEDILAQPVHDEEYLYFYQDISGLNLFLHPINNKYIKEQFQDIKSFPIILEATLIEIKGFEQTETTQKRYKFINHLPLNCNVNFAEVELNEILSSEILEKLRVEMEAYKKTCKMTSVHLKKKDPSPKTSVDMTHQQKLTVTPGEPLAKDRKPSPELKYKVNFPISPSTLKLDDINDYPELSLGASAKATESKSAWQRSIPIRKKGKASKRSGAHHDEALMERTHINEILSEQLELKVKIENKVEEDPDCWKIVKPDKNFFNKIQE